MESSESLRRFVLEFYATVNSHDEAGVKDRCSLEPEASMIGTDSNEWFIGGEAVLAAFTRQFVEFGDVLFEPGDVIASEHGDAGWFLDRPALVWGDQRFQALVSGTVLRLDGRWQMVQSHMSMPRAE